MPAVYLETLVIIDLSKTAGAAVATAPVALPRVHPTGTPPPGEESVAGAIRAHVDETAADWHYRRIVRELHVWGERFTADFDLDVPTPVLGVARLRINTLGQYTLGRSAIGTRTTVTLNERWIASRPFQETLITLLHELVHAWDEWRRRRLGKPIPRSAAGAHGKPWRDKMTELGVVTGRKGETVAISYSLLKYLDRYGVPRLEDLIDPAPPPTTQRQLPKWVCRCPPRGNPVRAVYVHARCLDCGAEYATPEADGDDE